MSFQNVGETKKSQFIEQYSWNYKEHAHRVGSDMIPNKKGTLSSNEEKEVWEHLWNDKKFSYVISITGLKSLILERMMMVIMAFGREL
jgi:hypothetical protein